MDHIAQAVDPFVFRLSIVAARAVQPRLIAPGNFFGMIGMAIAIGTTLAGHPPADGLASLLVVLGIAIGGSIGAVIARQVPMTSMPELVAAFHSLVGMAPVLVSAGAFYAPEAATRASRGLRRSPCRISGATMRGLSSPASSRQAISSA